MSQSFEELESQAMNLSLEARARLAKKLLLSLDAPSEEENLALWVAEAERRLQELREGRAKEIPAEEAFRRARSAIS
jgi:putative addiction module component (TIGR02574 family)